MILVSFKPGRCLSYILINTTKVTYDFNLKSLDHWGEKLSRSSEAAAGGETVPHASDLEHLHLQNSQANAWLSLKVHLLLIVLWSISEFKLWVWVRLLPKLFAHFFWSRALYIDYMAAAAAVWAASKHRNKGRMTERINIFISVALRPKKK